MVVNVHKEGFKFGRGWRIENILARVIDLIAHTRRHVCGAGRSTFCRDRAAAERRVKIW